MAITDDILESYRRPARVIRRKLAAGVREDRALAVLMAACGLIFVAQWPALSRAAHFDPAQPLDARMAGALMGSVFLVPLAAYGLAGISHLAARAMGGKGSFYGARVALFWAMLAVTPLMLLHGLLRGFLGDGTQTLVAGVLVLGAFLYLWAMMLREAERP